MMDPAEKVCSPMMEIVHGGVHKVKDDGSFKADPWTKLMFNKILTCLVE